jgi:hypothetical protein
MQARSVKIFAVALAMLLATAARAGEPTCSGTLSGAVKGKFKCQVNVSRKANGAIMLSIRPASLPKGVTAFKPGDIAIPAPGITASYPLATLTSAQILLTSAKHVTFAADKGKGKGAQPRGELVLELKSVEAIDTSLPGDHPGSKARVTGKLTAKLVPTVATSDAPINLVINF